MNHLLIRTTLLLTASLLLLSACAHPASKPMPMPPVPEGACAKDEGGGQASAQSSEVIPYTTVNPKYPERAFSQGVQGWVCLEFTVARDGTVRKLTVVASAPLGYFEESALTAVRQWRYHPFREDGELVEREGVRLKLTFELAPQ